MGLELLSWMGPEAPPQQVARTAVHLLHQLAAQRGPRARSGVARVQGPRAREEAGRNRRGVPVPKEAVTAYGNHISG